MSQVWTSPNISAELPQNSAELTSYPSGFEFLRKEKQQSNSVCISENPTGKYIFSATFLYSPQNSRRPCQDVDVFVLFFVMF